MDARVYVRPCRGGLMFGAYEPDPPMLDRRSAPPGFQIADLEFDIEPLRRKMAEVASELPVFGDAPIAELRGGLPTMTPDGHFIVDRLPGTTGLFVTSGCNVGGLSISPPIGEDLSAGSSPGETGRAPSRRFASTASAIATRTSRYCGRTASRRTRTNTTPTRWRTGVPPASPQREQRTDEHRRRTGGRVAAAAQVPIFSRTATGLVRQVSLFQQIIFNLASSNALGQGLVFFLSVVVLFPRANIYIALAVAAFASFFVWTTFGLLSGAIPRIGGDYTINSRVLPPWLALGGNIGGFMGGIFGVPIFGYFMATLRALAGARGHRRRHGLDTVTKWSGYFAPTTTPPCSSSRSP